MIDAWLQALGAWGYALLGFVAFLEYVVPPIPGDVVTVAGGAWAAHEERSLLVLHLAMTAGGVLGAAVMWAIGRAFEQRLAALDPQRKLFGLSVEQLHRTQAALRRRSTSLLVLNRFLPGFRAVVFFAAGASNVPFFKAIGLGALSAAMLNGLLLFAGVTIGHNEEALAAFFKRFQLAGFVLLGVVLLAFGARWLWRRRAG